MICIELGVTLAAAIIGLEWNDVYVRHLRAT